MKALYRKRFVLPSLALLLLAGCDGEPPTPKTSASENTRYLQAVQDAEALRHSIEQRDLDARRIDALLPPAQSPAR